MQRVRTHGGRHGGDGVQTQGGDAVPQGHTAGA